MIPQDRPIYGNDLDALRSNTRLKATASEMAFLLGVSMIKWTELVKAKQRMPINTPAVEIMIRFLDKNLRAAAEMPILVEISPQEVYELSNKLSPITMKEFAVSVGRQASSGYRWMQLRGNTSATLKRVLWLYKWNISHENGIERRAQWDSMVHKIGQVNGLPDVFKMGFWNKARARRVRAAEAAKAAKSPKATNAA